MWKRLNVLTVASLLVLLCVGINAQRNSRPDAVSSVEQATPVRAQDVSESRAADTRAEGTPVLVWIKGGEIVAIGLDANYKDKRLMEGAHRATARARGNKLFLTFQGPLAEVKRDSLKAATALQFEAETAQAFGEACGVEAGEYGMGDARSASPTVEVTLVQRPEHRRRPSKNRDPCKPFAQHRWLRSIFR